MMQNKKKLVNISIKHEKQRNSKSNCQKKNMMSFSKTVNQNNEKIKSTQERRWWRIIFPNGLRKQTNTLGLLHWNKNNFLMSFVEQPKFQNNGSKQKW